MFKRPQGLVWVATSHARMRVGILHGDMGVGDNPTEFGQLWAEERGEPTSPESAAVVR